MFLKQHSTLCNIKSSHLILRQNQLINYDDRVHVSLSRKHLIITTNIILYGSERQVQNVYILSVIGYN